MARLNEPATESVESLKRRFVRQNRELARNNSAQSVKIRGLETQVSQLVAENVSLRSTIIRLETALGESRTRQISDNVDDVKRQLEEKLKDLGSLVANLGNVKKVREKKKRSMTRSPNGSPAQRTRWNAPGISEALAAEEGRLPTIVEGKHFPRKTLEPNDVIALISGAPSDSPDIGPPPRTLLDQEDGPQVNSSPERTEFNISGNTSDVTGLLSANFETRRKRRETSVRRDSLNAESSSPKSSTSRSSEMFSGQPIRAGAKRKLDQANRPNDDTQATANSDNGLTTGRNRPTIDIQQPEARTESPTRKALAPRSVNVDPTTSPKKLSTKESVKERQMKRSEILGSPKRSRSKGESQESSIPFVSITDEIAESVEIALENLKLEPKTPGVLELASPPSTQPSDMRPEGRGDTPPPADITSRTATGADGLGVGRTSRRARSNVSYAEPNLISKMRRPTKDLVDAVNSAHRRSVSAQHDEQESKSEEPSNAAESHEQLDVIVKREKSESSSQPILDNELNHSNLLSPLGSKNDPFNDAMETLKRRDKRRVSVRGAATNDENTTPSAVISALSLPSRPKTTGVRELDVSSQDAGADNVDVFDVMDSPPPVHKTRPFSDKDTTQKKITASDLPARTTASKQLNTQAGRSKNTSSSSSTLSKPRHRRQTLGAGSNSNIVKSEFETPSATSADRKELKSARSVAKLSERVENKDMDDRAVGRRRSMML